MLARAHNADTIGGDDMKGRDLALAALLCFAGSAAQAGDFYRGKQLSLLINLSAGGPTDTEARLLARHLSQHIPGNPAIVPRIMTGAAGIVAANWLGQVAPSDGLTLGFFSTVASASMMAAPSLKIDIGKLAFIGSGSGVSVTYVRKDTGAGIKAPEDIMKLKELWMGGLAVDSDKDLRLRLQLDLLGVNYKYVTGYPGAADIRLAIERGEVHMTSESMPSYRAAVEPGLVNKGVVIPAWIDNANEATNPHPHEAEGIAAKTFYEFFKQVKGKAPEGLKWDAFDTMNTVARGYERVLVMAPNTPPEAVAAVKQALVALRDDPEFRKDALNTIKFVPNYDGSPAAQKTFVEKSAPKRDLIAFFEKYIAEGKTAGSRK
jgi:tripartite-type tricarboxylate transporter receptor subunit TctC